MTDKLSGYDIIGDIHGHATALKRLLRLLGYRLKNKIWQHPERKALFVGDFIDRGPQIRETLQLVKGMTDNGYALTVMGNHEYNALAFHYHHPDGGHIRRHNPKNLLQHYETIRQFRDHATEWEGYLAWFANMPLFLELDGFRVVHACWEDAHIAALKQLDGPLTKEILLKAHDKKQELHKVFEETLKGKEIRLPDGHYFTDKDGNQRTECRTRWWLNPKGLSYADYLFHAPDSVKDRTTGYEYGQDSYHPKAPTVFFGHYWLDGKPEPAWQAPNVCCLDYSVAKGGKLVACRWEKDEQHPLHRTFVTVDAK